MPPEILGSLGLTIGALTVVGVLWREHITAHEDLRKDRDEWKALAQASQASTGRLAELVEQLLAKIPTG